MIPTKLKDYLVLSFKNLKRRGVRSWLTLLGIFIGVTAVIALISLGDGLQAAVNSQFGVSSTQLITIQAGGVSGMGPPGSFVVKPLTEDDVDAIEKIGSVNLAIGRIIKTFKAEYNDKLQIIAVGSVPEDKAEDVYRLQEVGAQYGRLISRGDEGKVTVGNNFADKDKSGFSLSIMPGNTIDIADKKFRVVGVAKKKGSFILDNAIFMLQNDVKELINDSNEVSVIIAEVKSKDLIAKAKEDIEDLLRQRRDVKKGEEDFEVSTPEATLETINQILNGVKIFIVLIAAISIIIGAIGIINTMTTSVLERRKEIGIMKAIGARNSDIFLQFLIEAGMLGLIGGILGVVAGAGVGYIGTSQINNFIGAELKPHIDFALLAMTLAGSFIIGAVSGIAPAIKAAKQRPVEVLRG